MNQEDIQKTFEAMGKCDIRIAGDLVMEKHVEYEVENVEPGGIGIQLVGKKEEETTDPETGKSVVINAAHCEELSFLIHPSVTEEQEWQIHDEIKRLVKRQGIQEISQYLWKLKNEQKVLLPQNAEKTYNELLRLGMPNTEGYSLKTFMRYYKR